LNGENFRIAGDYRIERDRQRRELCLLQFIERVQDWRFFLNDELFKFEYLSLHFRSVLKHESSFALLLELIGGNSNAFGIPYPYTLFYLIESRP